MSSVGGKEILLCDYLAICTNNRLGMCRKSRRKTEILRKKSKGSAEMAGSLNIIRKK